MELRTQGTREPRKHIPLEKETNIFPILDGILLVPGRLTMSLALRLTTKRLNTKGVEMILVLKAFLFVREIS